jgi:hypothetical protein
VPNAESVEAVAKLVAARTRLTEITKQLNEARFGAGSSSAPRAQYAALEKEWEQAFLEFQGTVETFLVAIKKARNQDF